MAKIFFTNLNLRGVRQRGVLLVIVFLSFFTYALGESINKKVIDLSLIDTNYEKIYSIGGQWEFYWNQLLSPSDFKKNDYKGESIEVPGAWNRQFRYPALGYATYRIHLKLPANNTGLIIYFPVINSSAKIWINGEVAAESGCPSSDPARYVPKLAKTILEIPANTTNLEMIVQVVNYNYFIGGFSGLPQLGKVSQVISKQNQLHGIENFFAGSLVAMFIYQMILYLLHRRGKPYLWLSLICLGVALRAMVVHGGSFLLPHLFPDVSWEIWKKIEFESVYAISAFFPLYIYNLFPEQAPKWPIRIFVGIASALCLIVLITPQYVYGRLLELGHISLLFAFFYAIYSVAKAWKGSNRDARIIFYGVVLSFPFILTEILKNSLLHPINIKVMFLVEMGVLVFLLFQVYLLANHYANSFNKLQLLNNDLEKIVTARTEQLVTANNVKDKLLSVMSHDLKSPLNSLKGILNIYNGGHLTDSEFKSYSKRIEEDLDKTSLLIDNVLYWTASQIKGVRVRVEEISLTDLLRENRELFQTAASRKNLDLSIDTSEKILIKFDRNILDLTIRNLISNAIKFSNEGEQIRIDCHRSEDGTIIRVIDSGVGMDGDTIESLLSSQSIKSRTGTGNEKGTGLGLSLCREYLHIAGGQLEIQSKVGEGSTFSILLPD